jgi:putative membrane protein
MRLLLRWLILAAAIWLTAVILPGLNFTGSFWNLLLVALVFGLINAVIRPIVKLLTLPITIMTLGLFALVVNALMLWLTVALLPTLSLTGTVFQNLVTVLLGSILISIVSAILSWFLPDKD